MSTFKWTGYNTPDTALTSTSMNGLSSGGYSLGPAIDNTSGLYLYGDLVLVLSSAVTPPAGSIPTVNVALLPSPDGTNYPTSLSGTAGNLLVGVISSVASVATSVLVLRGIVLPPALFKIQVQNNLGVAFPATTTSTCKLYRYNEQAI